MSDFEGPSAVEVESLRYRYPRRREPALDGISFEIRRGTLLGVVGPNGSGKTTLYRLMLGFLRPQSGRVTVAGEQPGRYRMRRGIGYLPEQVRLPGAVRVLEFAALMAHLAGLRGRDAGKAIGGLMAILDIEDKADEQVRTLSHGYRQRVGLLAALLGAPELLLLDEPANGLDPASVGILRSVLRALKRRGRTVLVSSHNLLELERVCDELLILRGGRLLGRCSREELVRQGDIWVVRHDARRPLVKNEAVAARLGGVRLAADETAFLDRRAAVSFAGRINAGGGAVEAVERRPFDLEYLFHHLVQNEGGQGRGNEAGAADGDG